MIYIVKVSVPRKSQCYKDRNSCT